MVRASMPRAISGFERLLLFFGFLMLFLFAAAHVYTSIYSHAAIRAFWGKSILFARVPALIRLTEISQSPISVSGHKNVLKLIRPA